MKKKVVRSILLIAFIALAIFAIVNVYEWIVSGKQNIKISTSTKAYSNSDLYISIAAQKNGVDLETKSKIKLLDSNGKKVKNTKVAYNENSAIISIPDVEAGEYYIEAKVSSKEGKDTIQKEIYISNGNLENTTITFDKGIYKPGDTVNFRALLTNKENDEPIVKETNISIYDGNDNKVYNENVKTSDYGIVSGSFTLANEVNSGNYKLVVKTDGIETTKQFKVNPYVTPKYETKITTDKQSYLVNDMATINIESKYFFGEPVSDAKYVVYINGSKYQEVTSDQNGKASINYKIDDVKAYTIKVEAQDTSNYFVEATSSFTAGTDLFEISLLSEYGSLISGEKNDVYVFTSKADGTPVKTYLTISSGKYTKQVATDENGIGKFSIDIDSASNTYSNRNRIQTFNVTAENMQGEKIQKNINMQVTSKSLLLSTDKVKYNQGEDINLKISSLTENIKNIYFFKNDKLIKMINTDLSETKVNLDDVYGLIDIYITDKQNSTNNTNRYGIISRANYVNTSSTFKKTIFIKPSKQLSIGIQTDKEEYKPGENLAISFDTQDENKNKVEAALLVSMLDNSILSLANNDLSIDNIKLALEDINFSSDLDAATLYSCILDDNSEQTIMALLLKQGNQNIKISETTIQNYEAEEKAQIRSIISITILVTIIMVVLLIKFKKFRNVVKHILNATIFIFTIIILEYLVIEEFYWRWIYNEIAKRSIIVLTSIGVLVAYILWASKYERKFSRTSISMIISYLALIIITTVGNIFGWVPIAIILGTLTIAVVILGIIIKVNEKKEIKVLKKIEKELVYILKFGGATISSLIISTMIQAIIKIDEIALPLTIIGIYLLNALFNRLGKEEKVEKNNNRKKVSILTLVIIIFAVIGVGTVIYNVIHSLSDSIYIDRDYRYGNDDVPRSSSPVDALKGGTSELETPTTNSATSKPSGSSISSLFDSIAGDGIITNAKSRESALNASQPAEESNSQTEVEAEVEVNEDNNIRNVFLESMCFVPELITSNGSANLNLKLSDNITTWTLQTIGNTKDGRVGYGKLDTVKVFKDFFVDFELPKNLIKEDKVSIPVTVYNYTDNAITTNLKVKEENWFSLENKEIDIEVNPQSSKMVYLPLTILETGEKVLRIEATGNSQTDIVEKSLTISPKGYKVEKVVSSGSLEGKQEEDILILENIIENTASAKVKIYASPMAQTVEGMENIFRMPTGCFEQISSSLYPNILALKYMEENQIVNEELKQKALNYISSGYQKLLTYEVKGEAGGYSLYGKSPAETVLTAYGLMELTDLKDVYKVDDSVTEKMMNFLYKKQKANGSFTITGSHVGGAGSREELALNAYITWALSESDPHNEKLTKSIDYLKGKLDKVDDNYTLALIANVFANVKDKETDNVIKRLVNNINIENDMAYITSNVVDYYGSRTNSQTMQTVALTSMALSKASKNSRVNKQLINYLISKKDIRGTWYSTQATILSLKALNEVKDKNKLENQTITVKVNSDERNIQIKDNPLELYELAFENLNKENKLEVNLPKGSAYYEVVTEYYIPYENINTQEDKIAIILEANSALKVNDILDAKIKLINKDQNEIYNGMVTIQIPQGFVTMEDSLALLQSKGIIEKYETSYSSVNIYLRNFDANQIIDLDVKFRASYPVDITGLSIRAYDYYNPEIEGKLMPIQIKVAENK